MTQRNEGTPDRAIRALVGLGLMGFGLATGNPVGLIGIVPLATGALGFCPLYRLFGIQTCGRSEGRA